MKKEKMNLWSCILMGIGSIIGASVFASTPIAIKIVGGAWNCNRFYTGRTVCFCPKHAGNASGFFPSGNRRLLHVSFPSCSSCCGSNGCV